MPRTFLELQTKSETADARRALWEYARSYIDSAENAGLYVDLIDERFASGTDEWTFLVIMITGEGTHAPIANLFSEQELTSQSLLSATLFHESDSEQTEVDPSEVKVNYYRLNNTDSAMIFHTNCNVELKHIATGVVVRSQNDRSRSRNYQNALGLLRCHLSDKMRHQ